MTQHTIDDLRDHLFATMTALRDKDNPMDIARAKAVADVAQTVINSAKVEVDMINAVGGRVMKPTGFLSGAATAPGNALGHESAGKSGNGLPPQGPSGSL